ncbi:MAG: cardiolipin synthase [Desulfofustis sp.]|nr:cardiolipin synthase [Desulfofustis sp.]
MLSGMTASSMVIILHVSIQLALIARALLRPHRDPASRIAWIVVIVSLPFAGFMAYLLLGETSIGRRRVEQMKEIIAQLPDPGKLAGTDDEYQKPAIPERLLHLFLVGRTVNGFDPIGGNRAELMKDSNAAIQAMVTDIDNARETVHLIFYIWLADNNGCRIVEALKRAAARGVTCRAIADDLGSRNMISSTHWQAMREAGVHLASALPIGNPLLRPLKGRIDLRNHRKIVVIDNQITYCGSQNCADPEFLVKAKYAPWVDAMMRFEGPIARQNQYLFASDWQAEAGEDISVLLRQPRPPLQCGMTAQVIGTGPTVRFSAMPEVFESLMYGARRELIISTPYYVPDESMQSALCACARRGVDTTIIFPARNDSWIVGAASRSYYHDLLASGVSIFEYQGGLLHTKSLTLDGEITLIGSANMDRRSFDLNYENNILFYDPSMTAEMRQRQQEYLNNSTAVTADMVKQWNWQRRLWHNTIAMLGPLL